MVPRLGFKRGAKTLESKRNTNSNWETCRNFLEMSSTVQRDSQPPLHARYIGQKLEQLSAKHAFDRSHWCSAAYDGRLYAADCSWRKELWISKISDSTDSEHIVTTVLLQAGHTQTESVAQ